jgi:GR25 family glycosyltransferase involved in LPS biosynthesis
MMQVPKLPSFPLYFLNAGFIKSAIALQSIIYFLKPSPYHLRFLRLLKNCSYLKAVNLSKKPNMYPVFVINRIQDKRRLQFFSASCAKWNIRFQRIEAVNCADPQFDFSLYNKQIAQTFYGRSSFLRGAIGCFLSHVDAWKEFLKSDSQLCLICEDDARFFAGLPQHIADFCIPNGTDLIFANLRLGKGLLAIQDHIHVNKNKSIYYPLKYALDFLTKIESTLSAPGGEGYLLTQEGAKKLLAIFEKYGVYMEVDWFLFFHSLTPQERFDFIAQDKSGRFDMLNFDVIKLNSYVMIPSLVEQSSMDSIIGFDKPENYIERHAM